MRDENESINQTNREGAFDNDTVPEIVARKTGVRRVNNGPIFILLGVLSVFLLVMFLVASGKGDGPATPQGTDTIKGSSTSVNNFALTVMADQPTDGLIVPEVDKKTTSTSDIMPYGSDGISNKMSPEDLQRVQQKAEEDAIRQAKLQVIQVAINSRTGVQTTLAQRGGSAAGSSGGVNYNDPNLSPQERNDAIKAKIAELDREIASTRDVDPTTLYQSQVAKVKSLINSGDAGFDPQLLSPNAGTAQGTSRGGAGYDQFDKTLGTNRWKLEDKIDVPATPYILRAGFVIPAIMISGINSDLPGQIMAQVSQNVYDTPTGKFLLVPQGSRLVGSYASQVAFGQERVLVAWQRIIFPDGKALDIGSMPGADQAGYSGLTDQVNNHYFRLFSSALLMSGITATVSYAQNKSNNNNNNNNNTNNNNNNTTMSDEMTQALAQQLGQVTMQLFQKNMNIAPTIEVRPGYRLNVMVVKDLEFDTPYRAFDY